MSEVKFRLNDFELTNDSCVVWDGLSRQVRVQYAGIATVPTHLVLRNHCYPIMVNMYVLSSDSKTLGYRLESVESVKSLQV